MPRLITYHNGTTFVPRTDFLRSISGWYETKRSPLGQLYADSGSKLKFSRWLAANGITDQKQIKALIETDKIVKFKVSCEYNDILRCSVTKHYDSCLSPGGCNSHAPREYCSSVPNVAVVFVADASGKFLGRFFIVHVPVGDVNFIVPARIYGNIPAQAMLETIAERTPMQLARYSDVFETDQFAKVYDNWHKVYDAYSFHNMKDEYTLLYKFFVIKNDFVYVPTDTTRKHIIQQDRLVNVARSLLRDDYPYFDPGYDCWNSL